MSGGPKEIPQQELRDASTQQYKATADTCNSLAKSQYAQGDYASAAESLKQSLKIRRKLYGEQHAVTADTYRNLGEAQYKLGDYISALESHKQALEIRRKLYGEQHPDTGKSYHDLGLTQSQLEDYTSALESLKQAVDIRRNLFGEDNTDTADSINLLGVAQYALGNCTSAVESFQRAVDINRKLFGEEDSNTAINYYMLGATQHDLREYTLAVESEKRALEIRRKLLGEEHTQTADSYESVGETHHALGEFTSAVESKKRASDIRMKLLDFDDENPLKTLEKIMLEADELKKEQTECNPTEALEINACIKGYRILNNESGGNCMFHALSHQLLLVIREEVPHQELRKKLVDYLRENPNQADGTPLFTYVLDRSPTWDAYLNNMEMEGTWGDNIVLQAAADSYKLPIRVITSLPDNKELMLQPQTPSTTEEVDCLVLGYITDCHYVSLVAAEAGSFVKPTDLSKVRPGIYPGSKLVYKMTANPRGLVLIINNHTFDPQTNLSKRRGSEKDVQSLQKLFKGLQFELHTKTNQTADGILRLLEQFAQKDHSRFNCFVVWLMSHGDNNVIFGRDGKPVPITTARDLFSNANCESLNDKPKLFFIQACRGHSRDKGVAVTAGPAQSDHPPETDPPPAQSSSPDKTRTIPNQSDLLIAYATLSGHVSFRFRRKGTSYVRCLVEVFREHAGYQHLSEMMSMVAKQVAEIEHSVAEPNETFKQCIEQEVVGMRKLLFFWPGL